MRVLLKLEFAANRKEPLSEMFDRVANAFVAAGLATPRLHFSFGDSPLGGGVSSVDRVVKRFPAMQAFRHDAVLPHSPATIRQLTNRHVPHESAPLETLREIAAGVPRSFPFHSVSLVFSSADLGEGWLKTMIGELSPGVVIGDSWWVSGRSRSLDAIVIVDAELKSKKLPRLPSRIEQLLQAIGKIRKTQQFPLPEPGTELHQPAAPPEVLARLNETLREFRLKAPEAVEQLRFPHDLPPVREALHVTPLGQTTGPKKPVLTEVFGPMGYDCKADSGVFTLRRRTPAHLTLEISLDVGSWSRSLTARFYVHGLGYRVGMALPVSRRAGSGQYPIGDGVRWRQIVENLAVAVNGLEKSFVPAVEGAAGPSPEWFHPEQ